MTEIQGSFFFGGSSDRQFAFLNVNEKGWVSVFGKQNNSRIESPDCHFDQLEISSRLGNTPRHISFSDGSGFETPDNDKIDELLITYRQGAGYRFLHWLESHSIAVLLIVILVSGFIWGSVKYGIPAVADVTAEALPADISQYLGQGTLDILDKTVFAPSGLSSQRQHELSSLFESYSDKYSALNLKVSFRRGNDIGANAMALPDGNIIFTDELVDLAHNDLELVAIFGHEVGHLAHRHMLRRVIQDSMLTVLVVMMTGDISSASSIVYTMPGLLLELAYSRDFETQADDFAYDFLMQNDIQPQYFASIMLRLMDSQQQLDAEITELTGQESNDELGKNELDHYLSTHPATSTRVNKFLKEY